MNRAELLKKIARAAPYELSKLEAKKKEAKK
jgi:hypothetical protein